MPGIYSKRVEGEKMPERYELTLLAKDGRRVYAEVSASLFKYKEKMAVMAIFRDITERKKLEEELKREREETNLIFDSSPILVFYKDKEGKFLRINKAFAEAMNTTEEKFLGKTVFDLYSAEIAQGMTNDDNEVLKSGSPKFNIIEQYESARGIRWVQTDKVPILDKSGKAIGLAGFAAGHYRAQAGGGSFKTV